MIQIYLNRSETLIFDYELTGLSPDVLSAKICIRIEDIELCFLGEVTSNQIIVTIPALNRITTYNLREGVTLSARLEVTGAGFYLTPWNGELFIRSPIQIKSIKVDKKDPRVIISKIERSN